MRYRVNQPQVINETIDGEAIMINLVTGNYYSLDRVGGEVWAMVEAERSVDDVVAHLGQRYDAAEGVVRAAVEDLFAKLADEGLVVPASDVSPSGLAPAVSPGKQEPFTPPRLERFTDMQDLILLDPVHEVDTRGWPYAADGQRSAGA